MKLNPAPDVGTPAGGSPAGVVDTVAKENPPPGLLAAGVAAPAWLEVAGVTPGPPKRLLPPVPAPPNKVELGAALVAGVSDGLLGVENPENPPVLPVLPPKKFPPPDD